MATITSTPESIFFGSPLTFSVQPGTAPSGAAFHRVMLDVIVSGRRFQPLSRPADGSIADFDISSCLKALHESYQYAPVKNNVNYPVYDVAVMAYDVWVKDGVEVTGGESDSRSSLRFIAGHYTDYERISGDALSQTHTRKPLSGELVCPTDRIVYTVSEGLSPRSQTHNVLSTTKPGPIDIGNRHYFVVPQNKRSRQFQFVNSRGVVESIRAFALPAEKMNIKTSESTFSIFERLHTMSRTYMHKQLKPSVLQLSSGFVNYEWARWWAYEFCASSQFWMLEAGHWIPCHVKLSDSTTVIDRTKTDLLHVDFEVQPDLNGPLW